MDFEDLKDDKAIQEKLKNFHNSVEKVEEMLKATLRPDVYEKLNLKEKVDYDLFLVFIMNTLYWMYLRTRGEDPNDNEVKGQLTRVKEYMLRAKQAHERNTIRPRVNKGVAGRFVKHGIQYKDSRKDHNDVDEGTNHPPNKKIKLHK